MAAGALVPCVMLPRFTTYAGKNLGFETMPVEVTGFKRLIINYWRGPLVPAATGGTFTVSFQESTDGYTWANMTGTIDGGASGSLGGIAAGTLTAVAEHQVVADFTKRWFRMLTSIDNGGDVTLTCWAVGFLETRES